MLGARAIFWKRWVKAGAAATLCSLLVLPAHAGNADSFYLSGEAALMGGAIVSTSNSGGSIWYNPAGLALLSGTRLDVNVSGYAVRFGATADFDSTVPDSNETRLSLLALDVVPAAFTLTRKLGDVGVGFGVFVPSARAVTLRTKLDAPRDANGNSLEFGYDSSSRFQEYHAGPGVGWSPFRDLNLGVSLLAHYRTRVESTHVAATVESSDGKTSWFRHNSLDSQGVGLELVFGGQLTFMRHFSWGFVVRTPAVRLGEAVDSVESEVLTDSTGTIENSVEFQRKFGVSTQVLTPFRFHSGLSRDFGETTASVEGSILLSFDNELFELTERTTWNARAGMRTRLSDFWKMGGGLFTDRSPFEDPQIFQQTQIDYYGATIAVDWLRSYGVYSKGRRTFEKPKMLLFGTTLSLSYAVGLGKIAGARVGPTSDGGIVFQQNVVDVLAHEITLHIGSSVAE